MDGYRLVLAALSRTAQMRKAMEMSHHFDFMGMYETFFILRHLAIGSREYTKKERLNRKTWRNERDPDNDWAMYKGRLRTLVSNSLIECAAKFRVIQDSVEDKVSKEEQFKIDEHSRDGLEIGTVQQGKFALSLRESCNKIIHATEFTLSFSDSPSSKHSYAYSYWSGRCILSGSKGTEKWTLELSVYDWCIAMRNYLDELGGEIIEF